jgi:hypothetical protein
MEGLQLYHMLMNKPLLFPSCVNFLQIEINRIPFPWIVRSDSQCVDFDYARLEKNTCGTFVSLFLGKY